MTENIHIQSNDGRQFAQDDHDNKLYMVMKKINLKDLEIIAMNY